MSAEHLTIVALTVGLVVLGVLYVCEISGGPHARSWRRIRRQLRRSVRRDQRR